MESVRPALTRLERPGAKYVQVRNYLRALATHTLKAGDAIPPERELVNQFGFARMTVRQAIDALVLEGILVRVQGRGTFVAEPKVDLQVRLNSFADEMARRGKEPSSRLLSADIRIPPPDVADMLDLTASEHTYYLYRLRLADGEPLCLSEDWVPVKLVQGLFDPVPPVSIYGALTAAGLVPSWGEDSVDADEVPPEEAEQLGVEPLRAVLRIGRRTFAKDTAICYQRSVFRADRYRLWIPVMAPHPSLANPLRQSGSAR